MNKQAFLDQFLSAPSAEGTRALPPCFHLGLQQGWRVAQAQHGAQDPDLFLRDLIFSRSSLEKAVLFLSRPLLEYLNAPVPFAAALPFTRFMAIVFASLNPAMQAQFDVKTVPGALRFCHAFAGELARAYHLPAELIPQGLFALLQKAAMPIAAPIGARCILVREENFLSAPDAITDGPAVTLIGPADLENGLGSGLRYMADGLKSAALPFAILNRYASSHVRAGDTRYTPYETTTPTAPINIIHFNSDMLAENLLVSGIAHVAGRYNIGCFYWETSRLSRAHVLGITLVDEIWVPTEFMRGLYASVTDKPVHCMGTVVNPPAGKSTRAHFNLPEDAFVFIFTYDSASRLTRKNPLGLVAAFKAAFPSDAKVRLVLKTHHAERIADAVERALQAELLDAVAHDPRMHFINATSSAEQLAALLSCCDCYVSLHRCEGIGYGMAEAMALGLPVIATDWSGNVDFVREDTGFPIPATLVPIKTSEYHYAHEGEHYWAEPSLEKAAMAMQNVVIHPEKTTHIAQAGQRFIHTHYSAAAVGAKMKARIETLLQAMAHEQDSIS